MRKIINLVLYVFLPAVMPLPITALAYCNKTGTYINVDGHEVKDPRCAEDSKGSKYLCRDGSFSFSEHRRGACSRHGGIDEVISQ